MNAALDGVMVATVARATSFVGDFLPVVAWVAGISLAFTVLYFLRDFFEGVRR